MGLPWNVNASMGGAGVNDQILRSLRFRSSASAYLNRTPASASNRTAWTWSGWVKRGTLGATQSILMAGSSASDYTQILFASDDTLYLSQSISSATSVDLKSSSVYRDPSAWYHVVITYDSTQATSTNRVKMYVNGVQITSFTSTTYPALNANSQINNSTAHYFCRNSVSSAQYLDGYLAEVNFIDGQQLTPASFGYNDPVTGVWQPAPFKGTYGTNGFYLPFTDIATTSGSNFGLGRDYSGNANYWNTNNISVTAGTTYDSMIDSPTSFSDGSTYYNRGNYATLNPINQSSYVTLSNANLTVTGNTSANSGVALSTIGMLSGKWYWETTITTVGGFSYAGMGISPPQNNAETYFINSASTGGCGWRNDASGGGYGSTGATYSTFTTNDIIGVAVDFDNGALYFSKNGTWINGGVPTSGASRTGATNTWTVGAITGFPAGAGYNSSVNNLNLGQRPFSYTPPTGFKALNTFNLPTPTIANGAAYMAATLYSGDGTNGRSISNGLNNPIGVTFQPDFSWLKQRNGTFDHRLDNSIVTGYRLVSNSTAAEASNFGAFSLTSTGISVSASINDNNSGSNYVAWQWKAGGTSSTNTSGSITSTVSVSAQSGFSVVTWTGTGSNATIGHGLGVAPSMLINKFRSATSDWPVYHTSIGAGNVIYLNTTAASASSPASWNNTAPTSSVFSVGGAAAPNGTTMVTYCFAAVRGYSAFGSYNGNGSTDGPFIYTGFRPRWILIKDTGFVAGYGDWYILDTSRSSYNVSNSVLLPDTSGAESVGNTAFNVDFLSNGFKLRTAYQDFNASGYTYIYAAFAENPFNYSRAR